jgi:hypothetical protein
VPALVDDLLSLLQSHPLVCSLRTIHYDQTLAGKVELKVRCRLPRGHELQVWLHQEPAFRDYAYQLFSGRPLLRWDNAPHYPSISTAPHHFHDEAGNVSASTLCGDPLLDLPCVLTEIEGWMSQDQAP